MNPIDDDSLIIDISIEDINEKNLEMKYKELLNTGKYDDLIKIIKTTFLRNESRTNNKKR